MRFNYILFDLDGTLTNPIEGIEKSINYAMEKMNKPLVPMTDIPKFIGPPLRSGYIQNLGFTEAEAERATQFYRERYVPIGLYENKLIDGAAETLERLRGKAKRIAMATSKPENMAVELMRHFELIEYFDFISGASLDASGRHEKTDVIRHALSHLGINGEKLSETVIVGDRFHDIEGAKNTGISSIAVLSGFGGRAEFEEYKADFIAENLLEACDIIIN